MIEATIIADSINPADVRLTTFVCKYPRFIHSEVMTHRMLSKNASSSRAIPVEKMIQSVIDDPAMPIHWGKNQKGMQAGEELSESYKARAAEHWLECRNNAVFKVNTLTKEYGLHKQVANRLLEPWSHMTTLISGTEWANFFALRVHKDAQPEFQELAYQMVKAYVAGQPDYIQEGQWHLPFNDKYLQEQVFPVKDDLIKACIGRCARVSYKNQDGNYSVQDDLALYERIANHRPLHATPMEHVAVARSDKSFADVKAMNKERRGFIGRSNFRGWTQYRKTLPEENVGFLDFASHLKAYERETGRA
jgi:thymidylate synthase ThyX